MDHTFRSYRKKLFKVLGVKENMIYLAISNRARWKNKSFLFFPPPMEIHIQFLPEA